MNFEDALKRLEEVVAQMERGDMSLDGSLKAFEEGIKLSRFLTAKLEEAEGKVEILLKDDKAGIRHAPFDGGNENNGFQGIPEEPENRG